MSKAALDRPGIRCINRTTSSLRKDPLNSGNTELDTYLKRNAKQNDRLRAQGKVERRESGYYVMPSTMH